MASISNTHQLLFRANPSRLPFSPAIIFSLPYKTTLRPRFRALKAVSEGDKVEGQDVVSTDLLRKPAISQLDVIEEESKMPDSSSKLSGVNERFVSEEKQEGEEWVDWEDLILEDTVPLVGFVRMILHSGKYEAGARLSPDHEKTVLERLLPYHPEYDKKIGCGIDYIMVGFHPDFESSRCMFIVRKDGVPIDFSYWKCIKGLIKKKYPLYADSFIIRHFGWRKQ